MADFYNEFIQAGFWGINRSFRGDQKIECPKCQSSRQHNRTDRPMSINLETGLFKCHHCDYQGSIIAKSFKAIELNYSIGSDAAVSYLANRGISEAVVKRNEIGSCNVHEQLAIVFPYKYKENY